MYTCKARLFFFVKHLDRKSTWDLTQDSPERPGPWEWLSNPVKPAPKVLGSGFTTPRTIDWGLMMRWRGKTRRRLLLSFPATISTFTPGRSRAGGASCTALTPGGQILRLAWTLTKTPRQEVDGSNKNFVPWRLEPFKPQCSRCHSPGAKSDYEWLSLLNILIMWGHAVVCILFWIPLGPPRSEQAEIAAAGSYEAWQAHTLRQPAATASASCCPFGKATQATKARRSESVEVCLFLYFFVISWFGQLFFTVTGMPCCITPKHYLGGCFHQPVLATSFGHPVLAGCCPYFSFDNIRFSGGPIPVTRCC